MVLTLGCYACIVVDLVSYGVCDKTLDKQTHIVPVTEKFQLHI